MPASSVIPSTIRQIGTRSDELQTHFLTPKSIEPCPFLKFLFHRFRTFFFRIANRQKANQFIIIRNTQNICHLPSNAIFIRNMSLHPTACIAKGMNCQQHILNGSGIILYGIAFIPICNYSLGQNTNHSRCCFTNGRFYYPLLNIILLFLILNHWQIFHNLFITTASIQHVTIGADPARQKTTSSCYHLRTKIGYGRTIKR